MNTGGGIMIFSEKLDYLMNLTKTTNSSLAMHTSLDPSHISRLRNGKRKPAKNEDYVEKMALYFEKNCRDRYQIVSLMDVMGVDLSSLDNESPIYKLIYQWLTRETAVDHLRNEKLRGFLDGFSKFDSGNVKGADYGDLYKDQVLEEPYGSYFGIEGRRESVIAFLSMVAKKDEPVNIMFYSDESMEWMTTDPKFTQAWANYMIKVIRKGCRIRIIHTISRDLDEMLSAISKWMPLYMTGAIEPYYYPKKRDGVFKRTLFVAQDTAVLTSSSVFNGKNDKVNLLIRDKKTVGAFGNEFEDYLKLCRPLMKIFTQNFKEEFNSIINEFDSETANTIIKSQSMSVASMSPELIRTVIEKRVDENRGAIINFYQDKIESTIELLANYRIMEILHLPDVESVEKDGFPLALREVKSGKSYVYTLDEFKDHIRNIIFLLKNYENYSVSLSDLAGDDDSAIYVKEYVGVIIVKASFPQVCFAINEESMTGAIWDYLINKMRKVKLRDRKSVIKKLEEYIK